MLLSQFIPPSPLPAVSTSLSSMRLYFCSANRFISTIFLDSMYVRLYIKFVLLFLTHFTLYNRF